MVFNHYSNGVITDAAACGEKIDHAVLAVGYGHDEDLKLDYYLVKNSWGSAWGENGYVRIGIQDGIGVCAIQSRPSYPETN